MMQADRSDAILTGDEKVGQEKSLTLCKRNRFAGLLFLLFFIVYFVTAIQNIDSTSLLDYPLGADTPFYVDVFRENVTIDQTVFTKHPLGMSLSVIFDKLFHSCGDPMVRCKLFYALFGALNIFFAFKIFSLLLSRENAILSTLVYGFSGSIWFFASFPESYIVTTFFATLYIYIFVSSKDSFDSIKCTTLSMIILILGTLNEMIFPLVAIIPLMYFGQRFFWDKKLLSMFIAQLGGAGIMVTVILVILFDNVGSIYLQEAVGPPQSLSHTITDVLIDSLFFNIAFPSPDAPIEHELIPGYKGFFDHSSDVLSANIFTVAFLPLHMLLLIVVVLKIPPNWKWILPFACYVGSRCLIIYHFNAIEAILYTAPLNLPLLLTMTVQLSEYFNRKTKYLLGAYLASVLLSNVPFFYHYLPF